MTAEQTTENTEASIAVEVRGWLDENWDPQRTVREWWAILADSGWAYPTWPAEWFGQDLSAGLAAVVRRTFKEAGVLGPPNEMAQNMAGPLILEYGTEEHKQRFLPPLAKGVEAWCQFFSEPEAGSDLASLRTRAEKDGDGWRVNGQKIWNSGTHISDWGMLPVRTDIRVPKHAGISYFLIDLDQPGLDIRPIKQINGEEHFNETFFDDAWVSDEYLLGGVGNGWAVTMATLASERASYAAGAEYGTGIATGEKGGMLDLTCEQALSNGSASDDDGDFPLGDLDSLVGLAKEFGRSDDPKIRQRIVKLFSMAETTRISALRAKAAEDAGRPQGSLTSLGYLAGVGIARATRDLALDIVGAGGMLDGADAPRNGDITTMALSSLKHGIQGGSEHVQRNILGERVLGLPKDIQVDKGVAFKDMLKSRST